MCLVRITLIASCSAVPALASQNPSFNVDIGSASSGFGVPSSGFGGAAGAAGTWNEIDTEAMAVAPGGIYTSSPLQTTVNAASGVSLTFNSGNTFFPVEVQNLATTGDDEALLDDCYFAGMHSITIDGLPAGAYTLFTYAIAPDNVNFRTAVDVPGSLDPMQTVGGMFAGYVQGVTHAEHRITVAAGASVVIGISIVSGFDSVNGLQIVPLPAGIGIPYCTANPNSTGQPSSMGATGSAVVASNDVTLRCTNAPPGVFGYFLTSPTQGNTPNPGGSQGVLCLGGSIGRFVGSGQVLLSNALGEYTLPIDLLRHPTPGGFVPVVAGETHHYTLWHRDANPNVTSNFANGLTITYQ